jgi:hypothetical protein
MIKFKDTTEQVIRKWKKGESVWSVSLGGIGPSYEQAIQVLLFEIVCSWANGPLIDEQGKITLFFEKHCEKVANSLTAWGLSGAQYSSAMISAAQILKFGYSEMMNKAPQDRLIQVSNDMIPRRGMGSAL